uniref:Bacterial alpha-2-macroglobulin MG10 domain-containing protein n=1 Tax=Lotharella oceanica TaxID=641309 RepID=A0A7S2TYZ7_9EUKA
MYYRIGMVYAPRSLQLEPANYGFQVSRTYAPAGKDDASNVVFDEKDKVWRVKLGERVKITVKMITTARRYHVALVDYLPAGLEPLNPALKGSPKGDDEDTSAGGRGGSGPRRGRYYRNPYTSRYYSKRYWPEHINLRDERAEAFRSLLWPGIYEFVYTARATTAGEFVVPPAKAEEMYSPELFGRSATEKFVVS